MKEKLSALMDGELSEIEARRLLEDLTRDPTHRSTWERYHLVRHAMRGELELAAAHGLPERVHARVSDLQKSFHAGSLSPRVKRGAGLLAMAASVAAISIAGLRLLDQPQTPAAVTVASAPATAAIETTSATAKRWTATEPDVEKSLDTLLAQHNEYATGSGMAGMPRYVRVVAHNPANR